MKDESLSKKIYMDIRSNILKGEFKKGDKIAERSLLKIYESSRTPIREAIKMLESEGWVKVIPKKGTFIDSIEPGQIRDIYQLRIAIEPIAVVLAIANLCERDTEKLKEYYHNMKIALNKEDMERFLIADSECHRFIVERTGNRIMAKVVDDLENSIVRIGSSSILVPSRPIESLNEWSRIIEGLIKNDGFHARNWMIQHLTNSSESALRYLGCEYKDIDIDIDINLV